MPPNLGDLLWLPVAAGIGWLFSFDPAWRWA